MGSLLRLPRLPRAALASFGSLALLLLLLGCPDPGDDDPFSSGDDDDATLDDDDVADDDDDDDDDGADDDDDDVADDDDDDDDEDDDDDDASPDPLNGSGDCADVTVAFEGELVTISGTPLGLSSAENLQDEVTGTFSYRPCTLDSLPDDPSRAEYEHGVAAPFALATGALAVSGSGRPVVGLEDDLPSDTFRYDDGGDGAAGRVLQVDGVDAPGLEVSIAISDQAGAAVSSDALPAEFAFGPELPHTFSLSDDDGTVLIQWSALEQED